MSPATARTIREALGLPVSRLAELLGLAGIRDVQRAEAGTRLVTRRHAGLLLQIEARARAMVEAAVMLAEHGEEHIVVIRYREAGSMPPGTAPEPFELHAAVLAALRLRMGERLAIVEFDSEDYEAWLGKRADSQAMRAAWGASAVLDD